MIIEELLRTFMRSKPARVQLLKGKGREHRGIAAKNKPVRVQLLKGKGHENRGIAADITKISL